MQKRFCSCGHMVMVNYRFEGGVWKPLMLPRGKVRQKSSLVACPACGAPLSIHTLR